MWDATGKKNNTNMAHAVGNHSRQRQSRCRYLARVGCSCRNERLAIQLAASYSILNFQVFLRTTTRLATVTTNPVTKTKNPNLGSTRTAIATAKTVPNANRALSNAKSKILFKTRMWGPLKATRNNLATRKTAVTIQRDTGSQWNVPSPAQIT